MDFVHYCYINTLQNIEISSAIAKVVLRLDGLEFIHVKKYNPYENAFVYLAPGYWRHQK